MRSKIPLFGIIVLLVFVIAAMPNARAQNAASNLRDPDVLCLYKSNSEISRSICDYYLEKRPGAISFGVEIPDEAYGGPWEVIDGVHLYERMSVENFNRYVAQPLMKRYGRDMSVRYIAVAKDVPIALVNNGGNNFNDYISANNFLLFATDDRTDIQDIRDALISNENKACLDFEREFEPSLCETSGDILRYRFAVTYLTGYTIADVRMMLDKAQMEAPDLTKDAWVLDAPTPEGAKDDYVFRNSGIQAEKLLKVIGVPANNIVNNRANLYPFKVDRNVVAYGGTGRWHDKYGLRWIVESPAIDMEVSNRAVISAYESFFAVSANALRISTLDAGTIADALRPNAFGGKDYSRSFSGGVGTVAEPFSYGVVSWSRFFTDYASGRNLASSFIRSSKGKPMLMAIGDPLMSLETGALKKAKNAPPLLVMGANQRIKLPDAAIVKAIAFDDALPKFNLSYSWRQVQGPSQAAMDTPVGEVLITPDPIDMQTIVRPLEQGYYKFRLTVSDGIYTAQGDVDIVVEAANRPPVVSAGPDMNVTADIFPARVSLLGLVNDPDGDSNLKLEWKQAVSSKAVLVCSGQTMATCQNPVAVLPEPGKYGFILSADDGYRKAQDSIVVTVSRGERDIVPAQAPLVASQNRAKESVNDVQPSVVVPTILAKPSVNAPLVPNPIQNKPVNAPISVPAPLPPIAPAIGVIASLDPLSHMAASTASAGSPGQYMGGFQIKIKNEDVRVSNMVFVFAMKPMSKDPIRNIVLVDTAGNIVAGPTDSTETSSNNTSYASAQRFVFAGPVTFPVGISEYRIRADIPSTYTNGMAISPMSNPPLGWTDAVGTITGSKIDVSSLQALRLGTITVSKVASASSSGMRFGATVMKAFLRLFETD